MTKRLSFKLVTPEKLAYDAPIESLTVMTASGEITVLPDHAHLITVIQPGELHIRIDGEIHTFVVGQGVLEVRDNNVQILVNTTETAMDLDIDRAHEAIERAKRAMEEKADVADVDYARIESLIERNLARVRAGTKWNK